MGQAIFILALVLYRKIQENVFFHASLDMFLFLRCVGGHTAYRRPPAGFSEQLIELPNIAVMQL